MWVKPGAPYNSGITRPDEWKLIAFSTVGEERLARTVRFVVVFDMLAKPMAMGFAGFATWLPRGLKPRENIDRERVR